MYNLKKQNTMTLLKLKNNGLNNFSNIEQAFSLPSLLSNTFDNLLHNDVESWMPAVNIKERAAVSMLRSKGSGGFLRAALNIA